jgi:arabinose-5-phosphate isomerase
VGDQATVAEAMVEMTRKNLGMTAIVDADRRLLGVFTDGDLRRILDDVRLDLRTTPVRQVMTPGGKSIGADRMAIEAARLMEDHKVNALLVTDAAGRLVGALNFHDLLRARVI